MSEKCKFCGAEEFMYHGFECGTLIDHDISGRLIYTRSIKCYERELKQLRTEIAEMTADYDRFQWLLKQGVAWRGCYLGGWMEGEWLYSEHNSRQEIDEFRGLTLTEPDSPKPPDSPNGENAGRGEFPEQENTEERK